MVYYFDTSALIKRYVTENGSAWVSTLCTPTSGNTIATAVITKAEMMAAFAAIYRRGGFSLGDYQLAEQDVQHDFSSQYMLVAIDLPLIDLAGSLAKQHALRGYDAVQLAAAVTFNQVLQQSNLPALTMICADVDLLRAAQNQGIATDDPNLH